MTVVFLELGPHLHSVPFEENALVATCLLETKFPRNTIAFRAPTCSVKSPQLSHSQRRLRMGTTFETGSCGISIVTNHCTL